MKKIWILLLIPVVMIGCAPNVNLPSPSPTENVTAAPSPSPQATETPGNSDLPEPSMMPGTSDDPGLLPDTSGVPASMAPDATGGV